MSDDKNEPKGKAKGGAARAASLTPEQRTEIAKKGANAKKLKYDSKTFPTAIRKGVLKIADVSINCFILSDGRRVISGRGMTNAIGMKGRGQGFARISSLKVVNSFENNELALAIRNPIKFLGGSPKVDEASDGFEAVILQDLCDALLQGRAAGLLTTEAELRYASFAEALIRSFAKIGIVALVDEATGYQSERPDDALEKYLALLIGQELATWSKKFPDEFYKNIYQLKGWIWPGMGKNRYSVCAHYTTDLVYERLAPGLLQELKRITPKNDKGQRKERFHQWLTQDIGNPMLSQHLHSIIMFQRLAIANGHTWAKFVKSVDKVLPKKGSTLELPFADSDE
jgi:P63C domain